MGLLKQSDQCFSETKTLASVSEKHWPVFTLSSEIVNPACLYSQLAACSSHSPV